MVTLVKHFIEAERSGNWELHLDTVHKMLPYFHASGHYHYAKAAHIYLQSMADLKNKMTEDEFENFTTKGYFTIRRSDKNWSGIMTDMTIEQAFMRIMKISGGLIGRGINDSTMSRWTMGMMFMLNVCEEIEKFCGVFSATSEQHIDSRHSRITRDNSDIATVYNWLTEHPPFSEATELQSISTGVVGDASINCHRCHEIGSEMVYRMVGKDFQSYKYKRNEKVQPLATVSSSIKINAVAVPIDPLLLFHRMCILKETPEDLKKHLAYELAPYPLSLFTEGGMRHGVKSTLYKCFSPLPIDTDLGSNRMVVVDGGFLLHRVVWDRNVSFSSLCEKYVKYVRNHFGVNAAVVFDGYPEDVANLGTKSFERLRRAKLQSSADIVITEAMIATTKQEKFLANERNKASFIAMLKNKLQQSGINVEEAVEDADTLIVQTAMRESARYDSVIIVGEDVDLLVLLTGLAKEFNNVFFRKAGKGRTAETLYGPNCLNSSYDEFITDNILFLHAFSGCDTTAAAFKVGKTKVLSTLQKNPSLLNAVELFTRVNIDPNMIAQAGERFFIALYGGDKSEASINSLRYRCFGKLANNTKLNLSLLPPTQDTARYHSFRTYHQVQAWLGFHHDPEQWGWKRTTNGLESIRTTMAAAPSSLLQTISCKCTKNCGASCGCRRTGLKCSIICSNCSGQSCDNGPQPVEDIEGEIDDYENFDTSPTDTAETEHTVVEENENLPSTSKQMRLDE